MLDSYFSAWSLKPACWLWLLGIQQLLQCWEVVPKFWSSANPAGCSPERDNTCWFWVGDVSKQVVMKVVPFLPSICQDDLSELCNLSLTGTGPA